MTASYGLTRKALTDLTIRLRALYQSYDVEISANLEAELDELGIPFQLNPGELYPTVVLLPPADVNGHAVLAFTEDEHHDGKYPGGTVLVDRGSNLRFDRYATQVAYTRDGGYTWEAAYTREYFTDLHEARKSFGIDIAWERS